MCVRERAHKGAHHVGSRKGEKKKETKRERLQRIVLTALEIAFSEATTALDHNACAEACARLATEPRFIFLCGKLCRTSAKLEGFLLRGDKGVDTTRFLASFLASFIAARGDIDLELPVSSAISEAESAIPAIPAGVLAAVLS
tara:strand:- start:242 stop:670 length:429 start_codon:yes stop_codon:yes gene_type:complete